MTTNYDTSDLTTGCALDGNRGHYMSADIILMACAMGWDGGDPDQDGRTALTVALDYRDNPDDYRAHEFIHEDADDATDWLNDNYAAPGHYWGMWEGDFMYQTEEWWDEFDY